MGKILQMRVQPQIHKHAARTGLQRENEGRIQDMQHQT